MLKNSFFKIKFEEIFAILHFEIFEFKVVVYYQIFLFKLDIAFKKYMDKT